MPAHRKLRQEDQELEARFGYIMRPCHKMEEGGRDQKGKGANTQAPSPAESGAQNRRGLARQGFVTLTELRNQNSSLLSC